MKVTVNPDEPSKLGEILGIGGSILGGVVGSIVPGVGTMAGAAAGGGAGKLAGGTADTVANQGKDFSQDQGISMDNSIHRRIEAQTSPLQSVGDALSLVHTLPIGQREAVAGPLAQAYQIGMQQKMNPQPAGVGGSGYSLGNYQLPKPDMSGYL